MENSYKPNKGSLFGNLKFWLNLIQERIDSSKMQQYEGKVKHSKADQCTFMECDQIRFIFQHAPHGPHTSSISILVLGPR